MKHRVSFFHADIGDAIGNLDGLELAYIPAAGQKVTFAGAANSDGWVYRVSHVDHVICFGDEEWQQVDVYLAADNAIRS